MAILQVHGFDAAPQTLRAASAWAFVGRLVAARPATLLRVRLDAGHRTPPPGEYAARMRTRAGWRDCSVSIRSDNASLLWCRPRPAAPYDVVGETVEVRLTYATT
jgi:hypothetical protein